MHRLWVHTETNPGEHVETHRLAFGLAAHAVEIVHDVKQDGRMAADFFGPQRVKLIHCGEVHRLPNRTAAYTGIADIGDDNAGLAIDAFEQCCASSDVGAAAHNSVVGHDAERREESMHAAAHAFVKPVGAGKDFGQGAIQYIADGQRFKVAVGKLFDYLKRTAAHVSLHNM